MSKKSTKKIKNNKNNYTASNIVKDTCFEDYKRLIETYDKIYDKVNITLAFLGVILAVIIEQFDYEINNYFLNAKSDSKIATLCIMISLGVIGIILMICAAIELLMLMRSQSIPVVDVVTMRNEDLYKWDEENVNVWLIDKYTMVIQELKIKISEKQAKYNDIIIKTIVSIILYAISIFIKKGV